MCAKAAKLTPASWNEAFEAIARAVGNSTPDKIGAISGDLASVEEIFALKDLMTNLGSFQYGLSPGWCGT